MSNTGWAAVVIVLIILVGGGWWYYSMQAPAATDTTAATQPTGTSAATAVDVTTGAGVNAANTTTIHYTASGFSPKTVTIKKGETVAWVDDTANPMWVAAASHPTHTNYDSTDRTTHCSGTYTGPTPFDQCMSGNTYRFVFSKTGSFSFHNHNAAQFEGTVVVQ